MKVAFGIYRQWGYDIFKEIVEYQKLRGDFTIEALIANKDYQFKLEPKVKKSVDTFIVDPNNTKKINGILKKREVDVCFFYSWSFIVKEPLLSNFICLCLHPSPLPKGRGGTPIQNQILDGVEDSAVSIFRMNEKIDAGPIYKQAAMSLTGDINDIFARMTNLGIIMTKQFTSDFINNDITWEQQKDLEKHLPYKRRTPDMSEIKLKDLENMSFEDVNNLVRGLLDPYPNAFIKLGNYKINILRVEKFPKVDKNAYTITKKTKSFPNNFRNKKTYLKLKDSFTRIIDYKVQKLSISQS